MSEFQREERYIVIKLKHQSPGKRIAINELLDNHGIDTIECVVVESDWSIYEETWENVQRLAEGEASIGQERDELARKARYHQQEIDGLVDRLRDTQSKRDALAAQVERQNKIIFDALTAIDDGDLDRAPFDEARDVYNEAPETSLAKRDAEQQKIGAASFRHEVMESVKTPLRPHIQGVFEAWLRRQAGGEE